MTGQRTLEDVGVKRTRQADEAHLDPNDDAARKSQPQPKKAHTEYTDAKHNDAQTKAKENQGSKSNAGPDSTSANQNKESEPKRPSSEPKAAESGSTKGGAESEQPAAEATTGEADAKAPLSTSVAKPEGSTIFTTL